MGENRLPMVSSGQVFVNDKAFGRSMLRLDAQIDSHSGRITSCLSVIRAAASESTMMMIAVSSS